MQGWSEPHRLEDKLADPEEEGVTVIISILIFILKVRPPQRMRGPPWAMNQNPVNDRHREGCVTQVAEERKTVGRTWQESQCGLVPTSCPILASVGPSSGHCLHGNPLCVWSLSKPRCQMLPSV